MHEQQSKERYLPRYWPSWLFLGLLRLLALLPHRALMAVGAWLGRSARLFAGRRVRIAETNLRLCYPELPEAERQLMLRDHFAALGQGLMEVAMAWWWPRERLASLLLTKQGLEHLPRADSDHGTILLTAHFTSMELTGAVLSLFCDGHAMYRRNENPVLQWAIEHYRKRYALSTIARDDLRGMVRALRKKEGVWLAPDQNFNKKGSVFVTFMGVPASTTTAASRYAEMGKAAVVPAFLYRGKGGYHLRVEPPLSDFPSGDDQLDTQRINDLFADWVRMAPAQYNWVHRRFKTQPEGRPSPYG